MSITRPHPDPHNNIVVCPISFRKKKKKSHFLFQKAFVWLLFFTGHFVDRWPKIRYRCVDPMECVHNKTGSIFIVFILQPIAMATGFKGLNLIMKWKTVSC